MVKRLPELPEMPKLAIGNHKPLQPRAAVPHESRPPAQIHQSPWLKTTTRPKSSPVKFCNPLKQIGLPSVAIGSGRALVSRQES